jgi:hypothetical protein
LSAGWAAALVSSSGLARGIGDAFKDGNAFSNDGQVPWADGQPAHADADARLEAEGGLSPAVRPRFAAETQARAVAARESRGAADTVPARLMSMNVPAAGDARARARAAISAAVDAGAADIHTADIHTADIHTADIHTADSHTVDVRAANIQTGGVDTKKSTHTKKMTARIHLRPSAQPKIASRAAAAAIDPLPSREIPALTEECAIDVAETIQGRPGKRADKYLAKLATQQTQRGAAELARLADMLGNIARPAQNDDIQPVPGGAWQATGAVLGVARQATEAWLLSEYLNYDGRPQPIAQLDQNIDQVLDRLEPDALRALHRRLTVDSAITLPTRGDMFSGQMNIALNTVGLPAARNAWAASTICDMVGKPLSHEGVCTVLRDANAVYNRRPGGDPALVTTVARNLAPLTMERCQYLLLQRLRVRAQAMLREKGIPVNDLTGIARTDLPDNTYAGCVAEALRKTLAAGASVPNDSGRSLSPDGQAARSLSDIQIRDRLRLAVDQFSQAEILAAARNLMAATAAPGDRAAQLELKRRVESHGAETASQQALGRQFTILCGVLADKVQGGANLPIMGAMRGWDWDDRLARDTQPSAPGRLAHVGRAIYRGLRRAVFSIFHSYSADKDRMRDAYAGLVQAASGFIDAVEANARLDMTTPLETARRNARTLHLMKQIGRPMQLARTPDEIRVFNESGANLMRAAKRYDALCKSPAGEIACSSLQLPTTAFKYFETAFRDALGKTAGERVNVLGGALSRPEWANGLLEQQRVAHSIEEADVPRSHSITSRAARHFNAWSPSLKLSDSEFLMHRMHDAVRAEPGIRASAEILRSLERHLTRANRGSSATPVTDEAEENALLNDIWALDQRFRPLESEQFPTLGVSYRDCSRDEFLGMGMKRLSPAERTRLRDAICDLDHPPPRWLATDELWLSAVRGYQNSGPLA